jgi:hypothetical protein
MNGVIAMKVHFLPLRHVLCDSGLVASLHNTSPSKPHRKTALAACANDTQHQS